MAKVKEIIGGYTVPGGRGGAAVAYACQLVNQRTGIRQRDIHEQAAHWAGLNHSTANWLTSPGPKSPAGILWDRRKEGRGYRCYPNELTDKPGDPRIRLRQELLKDFDRAWESAGRPQPGQLVRIMSRDKTSSEIGLILGFTLFRGPREPGGFVTSRQELDNLSNFDAGHCGIDPQVQIGERQAIVSLYHIQKES